MAALLGLDLDVAQEVASAAGQGEVCACANDNAPGQIVVSGHKAAVERAMEIAGERGAKRGILLPVSAPFHCPLMQPAADAMAEALAETDIQAPAAPLVANVTASAVREPTEIRQFLVDQVTAMVRWRESVLFMKTQGVETLVEVGSGKVLSGLTRRIDREMTGLSLQTPENFDEIVKHL